MAIKEAKTKFARWLVAQNKTPMDVVRDTGLAKATVYDAANGKHGQHIETFRKISEHYRVPLGDIA